MNTLKDLLADGRERDGTALEIADRVAPYSYEKFCTNAWKAGNLLGHYGVHSIGAVTVAIGPKTAGEHTEQALGRLDAAEPLLAVLGGAILGATVDVTPPQPDTGGQIDAKTLVYPAHWADSYEFSPDCTRLAYGGPPDDPAVIHFEREAWSENPIEPPEPVEPADAALQADGDSFTHHQLLSTANDLVDRFDLTDTDRVVLAADVTDPGTFVAGVLAPLSVGATIVIPESMTQAGVDSDPLTEMDAAMRVTTQQTDDERAVTPTAVTSAVRDTARD